MFQEQVAMRDSGKGMSFLDHWESVNLVLVSEWCQNLLLALVAMNTKGTVVSMVMIGFVRKYGGCVVGVGVKRVGCTSQGGA